MSGAAPAGPRVAVVGGGLAGLAAAVALGSAGCRVEMFEARRSLGGRAASFRDPASGELVDHCQHVSMGCCTNLADFCRRTGIASFFHRDGVLNFIGPDGRLCRFRATPLLPAPLHLAAGFMRLHYLSLRDRLAIGRAIWKLMRTPSDDGKPTGNGETTVGEWLERQRQSPAAIERFWSVILVSALGEQLDRASLAAARKVIVDGFLATRDSYVLEIPQAPLGMLYGQRLIDWFAANQVELRLGAPVRRLEYAGKLALSIADAAPIELDFVVLAIHWNKVADILSPEIKARCKWVEGLSRVESAPITGVHLWFDRPITSLPHAVLVGRLSQWVFNRGYREGTDQVNGHYYQVVISASRSLAGRDRQEIVEDVRAELSAIWPEAARARLLQARVVTERAAVFSARPGCEKLRPAQQTAIPELVVAGDWTDTGWPATMEGAVRSGYLAAEAILRSVGRPQEFLRPDLPRGLLARLLLKT
jgi:squalene-associated FAD-dependent desaturase